MEEDFTVVD